MKNKSVFIISKNKLLKANIYDSGYFSDVLVSANVNGRIPEGTDILIADENTISYEEYLNLFPENFKKIKSNFFISNDIDTYQDVFKELSSLGIIVLPPKLTDAQISQNICEATIGKFVSKKNAVCFIGSGPGAGVSIVSQSIAKRLAEMTNKTIGLLVLSGSEEADYISTNGGSNGLAVIKERLINNILSPDELIASCIKIDNLYILPGEKEISKVRHYHPEHIENLVGLSLKTFDAIILNCGCESTGMSIGGLNSCGAKYLITTQSNKYLKNFKKLESQIFSNLGIFPKDFKLILNKYLDSDVLVSASNLSASYRMQLSGVIPIVDYISSIIVECNDRNLYDLDPYYKKAIDLLSVSLADIFKFKIVESKSSRNIFKNLFKKIPIPEG